MAKMLDKYEFATDPAMLTPGERVLSLGQVANLYTHYGVSWAVIDGKYVVVDHSANTTDPPRGTLF